MEEFKFSFEKLEVWLNSRASVSVSSNIAEGSSRFSPKDQIRFIEIAYGSLIETYCQLKLCIDLDYISENDIEECKILVI